MEDVKHIFSESGTWKTVSEFITPDGKIATGSGESHIVVKEDKIINKSWTKNDPFDFANEYRITPILGNRYMCRAENRALSSTQYGWMDFHLNTVFSKYVFENSDLNGYEVITREGDTCRVAGALYKGNNLVDTWTAVMTKID